ncbi:MAG: hypothetical protein IPL14_05005 [Nitrospira sp.]|nr:hypothetical protein [Nitrospira sp.]
MIANLFLADIRTHGPDLSTYPDHTQAVRLEAERAKIRLSEELKTAVSPDLPESKGRFIREFTRDQLKGSVPGIG